MAPLTQEELREVARARELLGRRGLLVTLTALLGKPIEKTLDVLPARVQRKVGGITRDSLRRALDVALTTLGRKPRRASSDRRHKLAGAASGAVGGWFGLAGLAVELPVTTVIILRSIADVARSEGHDLDDVETRLACLEVFALGGPSSEDDADETGYYATRAALSKVLNDAAVHLARRETTRGAAPVLVRLVDRIAARFGVVVQDKVLLEAVPIVGAASGALINTVFLSHFQNLARGHFALRRLEREHGVEAVREAFEGREPPKALPERG